MKRFRLLARKPYRFFLLFLSLGFLISCSNDIAPKPISGQKRGTIAGKAVPTYMGRAVAAKSFAFSVPRHPFMAAQGRNAMHADGYSSDVHPYLGPLGKQPIVKSRVGVKGIGGQCATMTFNRDGNLVVLCAALSGFQIHLIDYKTLNLLADYKLPIRPSTIDAILKRDESHIMKDSSGAYFYLDHQDHLVMADSEQSIRRIGHRQNADGGWEFYEAGIWNLGHQVPHDCTRWTNWNPRGECDPITAVMPDYNGLVWWVSRFGRLGTLNMQTGEVEKLRIQGEEIQNGFSVAEDGVYIVSDHALYRLKAGPQGEPKIIWREPYDRGSSRKLGAINQGSGTTPTLMGSEYITITDNADEQMNLLVYKRQAQENRKVCEVPLFAKGHSVAENSMVAFNNSIILENNAGYANAMAQKNWENAGGGLVRIDVRDDERGCDIVWRSQEASPSTVAKVSAANGLLYAYTYTALDSGDVAWYFTAIDVEDGQTQYKVLTGLGQDFDNNWAPITIGPDGTAYVGTFKGLVTIKDQ